ncbi:hypothetical protein RchiOBHm_Chr5g0055631 [Rosa chinensis]|uniref:Uncharacterized protein n=1 Tax=Rosa chinensis TaxID=74649 RepID=A0A2P6QGG5_ROSCH|nr:hypothetical protein RchiOBHm_Chr5g0055631 [Rosa chinensis]
MTASLSSSSKSTISERERSELGLGSEVLIGIWVETSLSLLL